MNLRKIAQRFLVPSIFVSIYYLLKYRCKVSPRAEVELSKNLKIGPGTEIGSFSKIKATEGPLTIGKNVSISTGCFIAAESGGVTIGDFTMLAPNVSVIGNDYLYDRMDVPVVIQGKTSKGIVIGSDVWIGVGCSILDGVEIGDQCIIAPHSVVSHSIGPRQIAGGNPAKPIIERR